MSHTSSDRSILPVLLLPGLLVALSGCDEKKTSPGKRHAPAPLVEVAVARRMLLADRLSLTGTVEATRVARMGSPGEGPVIACLVREGDEVREGQLLARLGRTRGDDANAASARAELEREELELTRIEQLVETGALPGDELDESRVRVSGARARLARALERLDDYRIVAPWDGIVSRVHVAVGDFVAARSTLVEVFAPESLVLRFAVPEGRAVSLRTGARIEVTLDAHPGATFRGEVSRLYPEIDRRTHTRLAEGALDGEVLWVPGMFARVEVTIASVPDALGVPRAAVVRRTDGEQVAFVVKAGGEVERRSVRTGIEDHGMVQVVEGVEDGEQVAVAGHASLRDEMKVRLSAGSRSGGGRTGPGQTAGSAGEAGAASTDARR